MATTFVYNGIQIFDVVTDDVLVEPVLDKTGVDPVYTKLRVSIRGLIHTLDYATLGHGVDGSDIAAGFDSIIDTLLQPRRRFTMIIDGTTWFDIKPAAVRPGSPYVPPVGVTRGYDIDNGPHPQLQVMHVIGNHSMRIKFTVECHVPTCDDPSFSGQILAKIINFRWWTTEELDCNDWTTRRIFNGRLRVRDKNINPHQAIREWLLFPTVQPGFHRDRINLRESQDGLEMDFTVVDKEMHAQAPAPASKWTGHHTVTIGKGLTGISDIRVDLWADKTVDKGTLVTLAFKIIKSKLDLSATVTRKGVVPHKIEFTDDLPNNHITATATVEVVGQSAKGDVAKLINIWTNNFGSALPDDVNAGLDGVSEPYSKENSYIRATPATMQTATLAGLTLSILQDPCNPANRVDGCSAQFDQQLQQTQCKIFIEYEAELPVYEAALTVEHMSISPYLEYNVTSDIKSMSGKASFPFGESSGDAPADDTVKVIKMHKGKAERHIRVSAQRLNTWPTVTAPKEFTDTNGIKHRLLRSRPMPSAPELACDASQTIHRMDWELVYALSRVPNPATDSLPVGLLPYHSYGLTSDNSTVPSGPNHFPDPTNPRSSLFSDGNTPLA